MIERLSGRVVHREGAHLVVDVAGVGYGVEMPESAARAYPIGDALVTVWIRTYVREDVIRLYGFATPQDRLLFDLLTGINRVGPKNAMALLASMSLATLVDAVQRELFEVVDDVPGIGAQLAKTIVLGLKPKLSKLIEAGSIRVGARAASTRAVETLDPLGLEATVSSDLIADLRAALDNLGYKEREYAPLLREMEQEAPARDFQGLLKHAISTLSGKSRAATRARGSEALDEVF